MKSYFRKLQDAELEAGLLQLKGIYTESQAKAYVQLKTETPEEKDEDLCAD